MFGTDYYSQVYPGGTSQVLQPLTLTYAMGRSAGSISMDIDSGDSLSMDVNSDDGISMDPDLTGDEVD